MSNIAIHGSFLNGCNPWFF